jgi:hypothetical protein
MKFAQKTEQKTTKLYSVKITEKTVSARGRQWPTAGSAL